MSSTEASTFVEHPRQEQVSDAREQALARPRVLSQLEREELAWSRRNPQGRAESVSNEELVLWNFDVARADLKREHDSALRRLVEISMLAGAENSVMTFMVVGHASSSGRKATNQAIAQRRAKAVAGWLRTQGFRFVKETARGEDEPRTAATDGESLARNRRVHVFKQGPQPDAGPGVAPEVDLLPDGRQWVPVPTEPQSALPQAAVFESPIDAPLGTWNVGDFVVSGKVEGKVKVTVASPGAKSKVAAALKDGRLGGSIEAKLAKDLKAKLSFEPPKPGEHWAGGIKGGFQFAAIPLKPEVGLQSKPQFVFVSVELFQFPLPPFTAYGSEVSMEFSGKVKFDIGPGPRLIARLAPHAMRAGSAAAAAAPPAAVAVGVVGVGVAMTVGLAVATENAKEEGIRFAALLGARDAFASRVAFQVAGEGSRSALDDRIREWRRLPSDAVRFAVQKAYRAANVQIEQLQDDGQLEDRVKQWTDRYARATDGSVDMSFEMLRDNMFIALGGWQRTGDTDFHVDAL